MAKHLLIEKYIPAVRDQGGINTNLPATLGSTLAVTSTSTFTGVATFTAAPVFNGGRLINTVDAITTLAPTAAQSGTTFLLDLAAGFVTTLPAPVVGLEYTFVVVTTVTGSGVYKIITDAGTTFIAGTLLSAITNTASKSFTADGSTIVSINMGAASSNATGGILGSVVRLKCVTATLWAVDGTNLAGGTVSTPFANS